MAATRLHIATKQNSLHILNSNRTRQKERLRRMGWVSGYDNVPQQKHAHHLQTQLQGQGFAPLRLSLFVAAYA